MQEDPEVKPSARTDNTNALELKGAQGILYAHLLAAISSPVDRPQYAESEGGDTD